MALSKNFTCSTLLLVISLCVEFGYSFQPQFADASEGQVVQRSNTSFYGGVALWVTITSGAESCPAGLQTCTTGDDGTCCPAGTFCEDTGYYCCPIGVDCSPVVKLAPVCADSSWSLYEADGNGDILFCCLPGSYGLPGSGCAQDGSAGTASASLLIQATAPPATSSTAASETATTTTQGETTRTGTSTVQGSTATSGSGTGTSATQASSTPTKSDANKIFTGTFMVVLAAVFVLGLAA